MSPPDGPAARRGTRLAALLATLGWVLTAPAGAAPLAPQPRQERPRVDELLARDGRRQHTLGSTGRRVFAQRLEAGPGLRGGFGYAGSTPGFRDPILLGLRRDGEPLELAEASVTWRPSHLQVVWEAPGLTLEERKFISERDELVDRIRVTNRSAQPLELDLLAGGRMTPLLERYRSRQIVVALRGAGGLPGPGPAGELEFDSLRYLASPVAVGAGLAPVDLPPVAPSPSVLHLLCTAGAVGAPDGRPPARFEIGLDDGSRETVSWPPMTARRARAWREPPRGGEVGADPRTEWRFGRAADAEGPLMQLSYRPPPGRFLRSLAVQRAEGPGEPVLLAAVLEVPPETGRLPVLVGRAVLSNQAVFFTLAGEGFSLAPGLGGERRLLRSLALPPGGSVTCNLVLASGHRPFTTALQALQRAEDGEVLSRHEAATQAWYDQNTPSFTCSDPLLERLWTYRWFLLRRNLMRLDLPDFDLPVFFAGLQDAAHTRLTLESVPAALAEARWLSDPSLAHGSLRALIRAPSPDGRLRPVSATGQGAAAPHALAVAAVDAWAVHGVRPYLAEMVPLLEADWTATAADPGNGRDELDTALLASGARALARARRLLGEEQAAARWEAAASELAVPGSEQDGSCDLYPSEDPPCSENPRLDALLWFHLADWGGRFAQQGDAGAVEWVENGLRAWARAHFEQEDLDRPLLRRCKDVLDKSGHGCVDGLHAPANDLLVRYVGGLVLRDDGQLELRPVLHDLDAFAFGGLPWRGHRVDITWRRPAAGAAEGESGFTVDVDGVRAFHGPRLQPVLLDLGPAPKARPGR